MFNPQTIEDHATKQTRPLLRDIGFEGSASMDVLTKKKKVRTARSVTGGEKDTQRALKHKKVPFWQLAPDGETIERLYNPKEEPLIV